MMHCQRLCHCFAIPGTPSSGRTILNSCKFGLGLSEVGARQSASRSVKNGGCLGWLWPSCLSTFLRVVLIARKPAQLELEPEPLRNACFTSRLRARACSRCPMDSDVARALLPLRGAWPGSAGRSPCETRCSDSHARSVSVSREDTPAINWLLACMLGAWCHTCCTDREFSQVLRSMILAGVPWIPCPLVKGELIFPGSCLGFLVETQFLGLSILRLFKTPKPEIPNPEP